MRIVILVIFFTLAGCAAQAPKPSPQTLKTNLQHLYQAFEQWQGTPYRLGGQSRTGIDCSAFTQTVFSRLGGVLPRTTALQLETGPEISRGQLVSGDLVFFKTGWRQRHVGIYLEDQRFMHASTSAGVTISSLENPYWSERLWKIIRPQRSFSAPKR